MSITLTQSEILDLNGDFFDEAEIEGRMEYISRKRRVNLVAVVRKVLENELSDLERKVLLDMTADNKTAKTLSDEMNLSQNSIYKIRTRAEKKVADFLKYVLVYRESYEDKTLFPIEFRNILTLIETQQNPCRSIVHRLNKLMAQECICVEVLYKTPGLSKRSVDEIFNRSRLPDVNEIVALSEFFGTTADYLLKGDEKCKTH